MNPEDQLVLFVACVWLIVLAGFALPSVIAFRWRDPNRWLILAINTSVVGWAVALALSVYPLLRLGGLKAPDVDDVSQQGPTDHLRRWRAHRRMVRLQRRAGVCRRLLRLRRSSASDSCMRAAT